MAVRVLIADDSIFIRDIIRHHLDLLGCEVVAEAENAAQSVNLFRTLRPELVTLDVMMPQVNGVDALTAFRLIRQEDPKAQILVVSAVPFAQTKKIFFDEGALDYITKPFDRDALERLRLSLQAVFPELGRRHPSVKPNPAAKGA